MAPRTRHKRRGQPQGRRPEQRLADDLKRHQLAREIVPELVESAEYFLDTFPQIVRRRSIDRILSLSRLASDILTWTALGAARDENQLPARCFAASCFLDTNPHRMSWVALTMVGTGAEVRTYVREFASHASRRPTIPPTPDLLNQDLDAVVADVRTMVERLRSGEATSADGRRLGRQLILSAIALDPVMVEAGELGNFAAVGAFSLLEGALLTDGVEDAVRLVSPMEAMADAIPHLIEHAAEHLEGEQHDEEDEDEDEDDDEDGEELDGGDEDEEGGVDLEDALDAVDDRLKVTEEATEGATLAFQVACVLLIHSVRRVHWLPPAFEARVQAAGDTLMAGESSDAEEDDPLVALTCEQAAALLEADVPSQPRAAQSAETQLTELDGLVDAIRELAGTDALVDGHVGALSLIGAAAQVLQVGLRLGPEDADLRGRMAAGLGALDPLALADFPELRAGAARTLRELARSVQDAAAQTR
jgi:hypothetical protein